MRILSATEAISPAFSRTKLVLFTPYRIGRTWKLATTAYLSMASTVFLPWPFIYLLFIPFVHQMPGVNSSAVVIILAVVLTLTLIWIVIFYLISRLRFAYFDVVLNHGQFIAPAWRKYGNQSRKWTLFKLLLGTFCMAAVALPVVHIARELFKTFSSLPMQPGQPPSPEFFHAIITMYAAFFGFYILFGLFLWLSSILSDFIVPSLALEDTTLSEAFRRLGQLIRNEPAQFAAYAFLKPVFAFAGMMAAGLAFYIGLLIVAIAALLVAGIIGLLLHLLHVPTAVLIALGIVFGVIVYITTFVYGMFLANGIVMTFLESYLLYFLGGRYPMLGDLLDRSTPPPSLIPSPSSYSAPSP